MKLRYLFTPIWRMFDFRGTSGRAEYFTFAVPSILLTFFALITAIVVNYIASGWNWHVIIPAEYLNEYGQLWTPLEPLVFSLACLAMIFLGQFPMIALTVRRLRDSYANPAAYLWFLAPPVLFFYAFAPTFRDYPVALPDGSVIMRSVQLAAQRRRNNAIGAIIVVGGVAAAGKGMADSVGGMELQGGKPIKGRSGELFHANGSINNANNIMGGRRAHMRNGRSVKASRNKYTL